ncbi:dipeptidase [Herpetosiphon giganteus]|uniref:dipeptidase n=1 Tax=Herpetosiphon giganteus TaxID=2029754 RepID=UPI00195C137F|nr:dipeptidase [Herpetosiphon giganteus]MBM7844876.1 acetylornithine deacetylase/succinyl-diaminopimelate desuccinylase-like protein [Herpetosiphon giganteus]
MSVDAALAWVDDRHDQLLARFNELLRIPSVSTDPAFAADVQRCADWLVGDLQRIGFANCQAIATAGHPVVYGEWLKAGPNAPTILVYAHYDVQPVEPLELWETPPFEPRLQDGKLYARGSIDDKCGAFANLIAFEALLETTGTLPVNIKVVFEGEEETGSPAMEPFVREHKELLAADLMLICDGGSEPDQPLMFYTARGIIGAEVKVTGPSHDLHSGLVGGAVQNPIHVVGTIIAALHDQTGRIQIPGFYADVQTPSKTEQGLMAAQEQEFFEMLKSQTGREKFWANDLGSLVARTTALPTCDVNGVWGGYQGAGSKTIIPAEAGFKVTMRLVADQDPHAILEAFSQFAQSFASETAEVVVTKGPTSYPVNLLYDGPVIEALQAAFEATWGKPATLYRQGGSVPIMGMFQRELGMNLATLGFGTGENGHAPNEYLLVDEFFRGVATAIHFYTNMGQQSA